MDNIGTRPKGDTLSPARRIIGRIATDKEIALDTHAIMSDPVFGSDFMLTKLYREMYCMFDVYTVTGDLIGSSSDFGGAKNIAEIACGPVVFSNLGAVRPGEYTGFNETDDEVCCIIPPKFGRTEARKAA